MLILKYKRIMRFLIVALTCTILFITAHSFSASAFAQSVRTFTPVEDSYVDGENQSSVYGTRAAIMASSYSGNNRKMLLKFNIGDVSTKNIQRATLRLTPNLSRKVEKDLFLAYSNWNETTVNFTSYPQKIINIGYYNHLESNLVVDTPVDISLDITDIELSEIITIMIDNTITSNTFSVYTKEYADTSKHPKLIIEYTDDITPDPLEKVVGDVNEDGIVDKNDYLLVADGIVTNNTLYDITGDGNVSIFDLNVVVSHYYSQAPEPLPTSTATPTLTPNPTQTSTSTSTPIPTSTPKPTATPTSTPTATPTPSPFPSPTAAPRRSGIWISPSEIASLPTSGAAWNSLVTIANSSWGTADLSENESTHDIKTYAGALVAARTGDAQMRQKVIQGLESAMVSPLARSLELSRGLQSYVIAADIINYRTTQFESWVRNMLNANVLPHPGGSKLCNSQGVALSCSSMGGIVCTALRSANNWGGHARASVAAAAIYLDDTSLLDKVVSTHRAFQGEKVANNLYCEGTNWHYDSNQKYGVNPRNATKNNINISGVLPEDWRRGGEFTWKPINTIYMWEGMQGYIVTAAILDRAGKVPFNSGDYAVVRAMDMLYGKGLASQNDPLYSNPADGDDEWIPDLVNFYADTNYPTGSTSFGKGIGFTDWTHRR